MGLTRPRSYRDDTEGYVISDRLSFSALISAMRNSGRG
jgi:hypothetical protein